MDVTIQQLRIFAAVCEWGGFGAAADELGVTQSSVSHALAALERLVGGRLVHRSPQVRPTSLGETLLPHAQSVLASHRSFVAVAREAHGETAEAVTLAATPTACHRLVPELLLAWQRLTSVQVRLLEGSDAEVVEWLEKGVADAAIVVDPADADDPAERGVTVARDDFRGLVRRDHPASRRGETDLSELLADPLIVSDGGCEPQIRRLHTMAGLRYRPTLHVRELTTLMGMVESRIGVSVLPSLAGPMLPEALTMISLTPRLERTLVLTGPPGRPWHPAVAKFCAAASDSAPRPAAAS
ncbi:LysR family transcriptional regulator [Streptomyces sp. NPDC055078]